MPGSETAHSFLMKGFCCYYLSFLASKLDCCDNFFTGLYARGNGEAGN